MAKIRQIGNREQLIREKERGKKESDFQSMDEVAFEDWFRNHFSKLPQEVQDGLKTITNMVYNDGWQRRRKEKK